MARSLNIGEAVTFVRSVHPSRTPAFLEACNLIVSPSLHGSQTPLKIYGYMRSRRPLIVTDCIGTEASTRRISVEDAPAAGSSKP